MSYMRRLSLGYGRDGSPVATWNGRGGRSSSESFWIESNHLMQSDPTEVAQSLGPPAGARGVEPRARRAGRRLAPPDDGSDRRSDAAVLLFPPVTGYLFPSPVFRLPSSVFRLPSPCSLLPAPFPPLSSLPSLPPRAPSLPGDQFLSSSPQTRYLTPYEDGDPLARRPRVMPCRFRSISDPISTVEILLHERNIDGILTAASQSSQFTSISREAIARCVSRSGMKAFNSMPRVLFCSPPGHRPASRTEFRCKLFDGNYAARSPLPHETCPFVLIACVMPKGAE